MKPLKIKKVPKGWTRLRTGSVLKGLTRLFYRKDTSWDNGVDSFYAYGLSRVTKEDTSRGYVWFRKEGTA